MPLCLSDHGVSLGCANINDCEQTPEGLSKQMFEGETFESWYVSNILNPCLSTPLDST